MKTESSYHYFLRILQYAKPYRYKLISALIASVLATMVWLSIPLGIRELLDAVFDEGDRELLHIVTMVLIGLFFLQAILGFFGGYMMDWVGERMVTDLRKKLYAHLQEMSLRFYSNRRLGELTSRLTNDVASIRNAVTGTLSEGLTQSINLFGSVALMLWLNWRLSLIIFITVPVIALSVRYFGQLIRRLSRRVQDRLADTTAIAEEALSAIQSVKSYAREPFEIERYNQKAEELFGTARKKVLYSNMFWSAVAVMFMSTLIIIFWYGGTEVLAGRLSAGDLVAFIFFAFNIGRSLSGMARIYTIFSSAVGASERIFGLMDENAEVSDKPGAPEMNVVEGEVIFDKVSFAYEDENYVLKEINFKASPGDIIALVGPSGAGKTTLLNLIPRFYNLQSGTIRIDGIDISTVQQRSLRHQMAIVPQQIELFSTSVIENIRYGQLDATDSEVRDAAISAQADGFIMEHADGYHAKVGEKGIKLSGGQRQRIAIARAILKEPQILLLDEATSALDSESELALQIALDNLMKNRTTFVIAHRLSTIRNATNILVMDKGRIVQSGSHEELIRSGGLYKHLYDLQFGENFINL